MRPTHPGGEVFQKAGGQVSRIRRCATASPPFPILAGRHDDAALAVVDDYVRAVGFGEAWRALEELFSVHGAYGYRDRLVATDRIE